MAKKSSIILIGYSGHAFVVADAALESGWSLLGYCDNHQKSVNPFELDYLGKELEQLELLRKHPWLVAIGNNARRWGLQRDLMDRDAGSPATLIHPLASLGIGVELGRGTFLAAGVRINPLARVGKVCICNTGSIIEHECRVGDGAHIAPGAVLAAQVQVGDRAFIGAGAAIKQGIRIGDDAVVGAGAVVVKDVPAGQTVIGNPAQPLKKK